MEFRDVIHDLCSDSPTRTPAEVWGAIRWLPDTTPLAASHAGGRDHLGNGYDRTLTKATADTLRILAWLTFRANAGKKGQKVKQPSPLPTPAELTKKAEKQRPKVTVADLVRHAGG